MNWNKWLRQAHRWLSIAFTVVSAAIFVALAIGRSPASWLYYVPLLPLALLTCSGLYMFFLPYAPRRGGDARVSMDAPRSSTHRG